MCSNPGLVSFFVQESMKGKGINSLVDFQRHVTHLVLEQRGYVWEEGPKRFSDLTADEYGRVRAYVDQHVLDFAEEYFHSQIDPNNRLNLPNDIAHHLAYAIA